MIFMVSVSYQFEEVTSHDETNLSHTWENKSFIKGENLSRINVLKLYLLITEIILCITPYKENNFDSSFI